MTSPRTRERMVIRLQEQGIYHSQVLDVLNRLPRHLFVDEALAHRAYEDTALPIGYQQTLSQPYIVARMTELLLEKCPHPRKVLEIGTGSGYQTAVLAAVSDHVYSVERIRPLSEKTRKRFQQLKIYNVFPRYADGTLGWREKGPYDAIVVTAASSSVPEALKSQLCSGGVLIIPVGNQESQVLKRITAAYGQYQEEDIEPARFVPLLEGRIR
ncbi:protein-L-isoaspartate(D-aspartate) O-methyltransferase [Pokkaliibacter sp. CJK22405]|uniref:protein-L-isoaspartate(D-aspartate) O-methyltransferase n=1 Tax=Pokkaliibacter sp. CJK22405 TaxID=3384615 RepID=UPI0039854120